MKNLQKSSYKQGLREGFIRHTFNIREDYYHEINQQAALQKLMLTDMVDQILTAWVKSLKRKKTKEPEAATIE